MISAPQRFLACDEPLEVAWRPFIPRRHGVRRPQPGRERSGMQIPSPVSLAPRSTEPRLPDRASRSRSVPYRGTLMPATVATGSSNPDHVDGIPVATTSSSRQRIDANTKDHSIGSTISSPILDLTPDEIPPQPWTRDRDGPRIHRAIRAVVWRCRKSTATDEDMSFSTRAEARLILGTIPDQYRLGESRWSSRLTGGIDTLTNRDSAVRIWCRRLAGVSDGGGTRAAPWVRCEHDRADHESLGVTNPDS